MKKILGYSFACLPAIIPDALSLATQFSYFGAILSGCLLLFAVIYYRLNSAEKDTKAPEVIGVLGVAFLLSTGFSVYRLGSGETVTAKLAPELAEQFAIISGSQERLQDMIADADARLRAVEDVARLEAQLNTIEREKDDLERQWQARERELQAEFRQAMQSLQEKIEEEYDQTKEFVQLQFEPVHFSAHADIPGFLSSDETDEIKRWESAKVESLVFQTYNMSSLVVLGRPRNIFVELKLGTAGLK